MKKIAIIIGTRPEAIKLAPVYLELKKSKHLKPVLINTGQHKEMVDQMLNWFGIKEDYNLKLMLKNQSLDGITSRAIESVTKVLKSVNPSLIMVEGDTTTVMAASIAAFYLKIPVAHVEAGLRTNNFYNPFPEEMVRRVVSHIASIHFSPTEGAVSNLKKENIKSNAFNVGNTVIDALLFTAEQMKNQFKKYPPLIVKGLDFKKYRVILSTIHRRENFGKGHKGIAHALLKILNAFPDTALLLPLHKNPNVRNVIKPILKKHKRVFLIEPLDYVPFIYTMKNCHLILSDSGGVQEEAPTLGKPVLVLRTTTERPEGIKAGSAKLVGIDPDKIFKEAAKLLSNKEAYKKMSKVKNPYGDGKTSKRIKTILEKLKI